MNKSVNSDLIRMSTTSVVIYSIVLHFGINKFNLQRPILVNNMDFDKPFEMFLLGYCRLMVVIVE
mgnify:CR=1 FL=1